VHNLVKALAHADLRLVAHQQVLTVTVQSEDELGQSQNLACTVAAFSSVGDFLDTVVDVCAVAAVSLKVKCAVGIFQQQLAVVAGAINE